MQSIFLTGNLAADCEIIQTKDGNELMKFVVAANEPKADKDEKPTYYTCRMKKSGAAELLKKGRFVSLAGNLKVSTNVKDDKTYVNLDVWINTFDLAPTSKDN